MIENCVDSSRLASELKMLQHHHHIKICKKQKKTTVDLIFQFHQ